MNVSYRSPTSQAEADVNSEHPNSTAVAEPETHLEGDKPTVCAKPRVRDRIFETACDLFYKHGIRDVGVDTIATEAGTNKMSFYRSFASKDELVAEYLEQKGADMWQWWDGVI